MALLKPTLEAEFGWSDQEVAHLGSVFQLSAAFALLAVGWFVDRFDVRLAVVFCAVASVFHFLVFRFFGLNRFFWAWMTTYPAILWCAGQPLG